MANAGNLIHPSCPRPRPRTPRPRTQNKLFPLCISPAWILNHCIALRLDGIFFLGGGETILAGTLGLGHLGKALGVVETFCRNIGSVLTKSCHRLGAILKRLGAILGRFWGHLLPYWWAVLVPSWDVLEPAVSVPSWAVLEAWTSEIAEVPKQH